MQNTKTIKTKFWLSIGAMFGVFGLLYLLMFVEVPEQNRTIFDTSFGMVIGGTLVAVYNFFFNNNPEDSLQELNTYEQIDTQGLNDEITEQ